MTRAQFHRYKYAFQLLDLNDDGKISKLEFEEIVGLHGLANDLAQSELRECFMRLDQDGDQYFDLKDLLREINDKTQFRRFAGLVRMVLTKAEDINQDRIELGREEKIQKPVNYREEEETDPDVISYAKENLQLEDDYLKKLVNVFKGIDLSERSLISKSDFDRVLNKFNLIKDLTIEEFENLFQEMDKDGDGKVGLLDFIKTVKDENSSNKFKEIFNSYFKKKDKSLLLDLNEEDDKTPEKIEEDPDKDAIAYAKENLHMEEEYIEKLRKVFKGMDLSGSSLITKADFDLFLRKLSLTKHLSIEEFEDLFQELDKDGDGMISLLDFLKTIKDEDSSNELRKIFNSIFKKKDKTLKMESRKRSKKVLEEENLEDDPNLTISQYAENNLKMDKEHLGKLIRIFKEIDLGGRSLISKFDFDEMVKKLSLTKELTIEEFEAIFKELDKDGDGMISLRDFLKTMRDGNSSNELRTVFNSIFKKKDKTLNLELRELKKEEIEEDSLEEGANMNVASYAKKNLEMENEYLKKLTRIFKEIDLSGRSLMSKLDFDLMLKKYSATKNLTIQEFEDLFKEMDKDRDGMIGLLDFLKSVKDENSSTKFRQIFNAIFKKRDKSLLLKMNEEKKETLTENEKTAFNKKREDTHKNFKMQIEEFLWWLDCNESMENQTKLNAAKNLNYLLEQQFEQDYNLSKEEKMSNFGSFIGMVGNELKQNLFLSKRVDELQKTLEEERIQHQSELKQSRVKRLKLVSRARKPLESTKVESSFKQGFEEKLFNDLKNIEKSAHMFNSQMEHNLMVIESEMNILKALIIQKDELIALKDSNIQEKIKENESLLVKAQELEQERSQLFKDLSEVKKDLEIVYKDEGERRRQIEELCKQVQEGVSLDLYKTVMKERDTLSQENSELKKELVIIKRNNSLLKDEKRKLQDQLSGLEVERNHLKETCNNVNNDLKVIIKDIEGFEKREKEYLSQISSIKEKDENSRLLEEEVQALREENNLLKSRFRNLELKKNQKDKENIEPNKGAKPLQEHTERELDGHSKMTIFDQEKSIMQSELVNLRQELEEFKKKEKEYEELIQELSNDNLREDYNNLLERVDLLLKENSNLKEDKKRRNDMNAEKENSEQIELMKEISQVEKNLKSLQEKENIYNQEIQELSKELKFFSYNTEDLRKDNLLLQQQLTRLKSEVLEVSQTNTNLDDLNQRLCEGLNNVQQKIVELTEERDELAYRLESFNSPDYKRLEEEFNNIKMHNQNLKVRVLVLEDRVEILEKEKRRLENQQERMTQDLENAVSFERFELINNERRDLKKENQSLKQQLEELRKQQQHQNDRHEAPYKHFTPTKGSSYSNKIEKWLGNSNQKDTYLEAIEKLKLELKDVRESREAIMQSLEKDRGSFKLEESFKPLGRLYYSDRKTPNKTEFVNNDKASTLERPAETHVETAKKITYRELAERTRLSRNHETIKKMGLKPTENIPSYESLSGQKSSASKERRYEELNPDTSKYAFQILYWLTDNAMIAKELLSLCPMSKLDELEIQQVLRETQIYGDKAKSYYDCHRGTSLEDEFEAVFEFILPLFSKCYRSQGQLKDIQSRIVAHLKEIKKNVHSISC